MIDHAAIRAQAVRTYEAQHLVVERAIAFLKQPPLHACRGRPLAARHAGASDAGTPPPASRSPSGSAVEAGRPANLSDQSDPGDECTCPACTSDCAGIVPCLNEETDDVDD